MPLTTRHLIAGVIAAVAGCSFEGASGPAMIDDAKQEPDATERRDGAIDAAPSCVGYIAIGASKYRHVTTQSDWLTGEMDCEDDEPGASHLAIIESETERTTLTTAVAVEFWIGLVDRKTEDTWVWVDGSAHTIAFPPWKSGEPSTGGNDDCAMANTAGLYEAVNCTDDKQYVCECDGMAATPAAYAP